MAIIFPSLSGFKTKDFQLAAGFWVLGLLNNAAYVIMLAGATELAAGAVGLVFFCAIFPTIAIKLTGPHWFHLVSYKGRVVAVAALMSAAYLVVAAGTSLEMQLAGVALVALQGGLGEASCLALATRYPSTRLALTAWSSGTGFAGVGGYAWVAVLHDWLGFSFPTTLMAAQLTVLAWLATYFSLLAPLMPDKLTVTEERQDSLHLDDLLAEIGGVQLLDSGPPSRNHSETSDSRGSVVEPLEVTQEGGTRTQDEHSALLGTGRTGGGLPEGIDVPSPHSMTFRQRMVIVRDLWPLMTPLFLVYFAEYAMQSGAWAAIGFPVNSKEARRRFYVSANWCYQVGVFLARSSGMIYQANRRQLWIMPSLQCGLLLFFLWDASTHFWYNWSLLVLCFGAGLLGGAVYVNAFTLLAKETPPATREFSIASASLADSLGVAFADVAGILIQGCLFKVNKIPGAAFRCSASR